MMTSPGDTASPAVEASRPNKRYLVLLSAVIVTLVTAVVLLVSAEIVLRVAWKEPYMFDRRLMFFSEGRNFQNKDWGGFAYEPNATIHSATYYVTNLDPPKFELEFEYRFTTNSLGRVQHTELDSLKPSILFLGDSFTEGQGAEPWFYVLENEWRTSPFQLVSGAVLGTGVEDWSRLYTDLAGRLNIQKAVIVFIGDDWHRPVWQFPKQTLACLKLSNQCIGDENFYGLPANDSAAAAQVARVAQHRIRQLSEIRAATTMVERSAIYRHLWTPLMKNPKEIVQGAPLPREELLQFEVSKRAVMELVNTLGRENVLFIYLPQRHELGPGPNAWARMANEFIAGNGYSLMDGRKECGLEQPDYHPRDGHPNARGYTKIEACVERATLKAFGNSSVSALFRK